MKTTKADFEMFKAECERWIEFFGLKDWEVFYEMEKLDTLASIAYGFAGKNATITLNLDVREHHKHLDVKKWAFHEVCELMCGELSVAAEKSYSFDTAQEMTHSLIRRLENSVYKKLKINLH